MSFVKLFYSEYRIVQKALQKRVDGLIYRDLDIWWQRQKLRFYRTGIVKVLPASPLPSLKFAVFVYYEPQHLVSNSVRRAISALRRENINILLVCNHGLSEEQVVFMKKNCHTVILRNNQGFDFGAYKDAVKYLKENDLELERLLIINDSVFYANKGLQEFIRQFFGPEDVIGAFENWGEEHHICSFALSVSANIFHSGPFQDFWRNYAPVNNRIHAIENGEKKLSSAAMKMAQSSRVIFPTSKLHEKLLGTEADLLENLLIYPNPWRNWIENIDRACITPQFVVNKVSDIINITSPLHAGSYFFPRYMNCPILKKDIVYRARFEFWEVETWLHDVLSKAEAEEFLHMLRKKSDHSALSRRDNRKFNIGVK